jgi:8-oxo-dGTP pyrophosphatase MutT (NUDIX family)
VLRRRDVWTQLTLFDRLPDLASYNARIESDPSRIPAAVSIICVRKPDAVLLIRRSEREGDPWSGQLGLPGGRKGPVDPDLLTTAVRETREEVGIDLPPALMVGTLDDLVPRTVLLPRIKVRPFVFLLPSRPALFPNIEVASCWWVTTEELLTPGVYGNYEVRAGDLVMSRPGYRLEEGIVWGMTERILTPFFTWLRSGTAAIL